MSLLKISRLEGLTDGIFAIAMTILVLDLHLPTNTSAANLPIIMENSILLRMSVYIGSFIILGTLWIAMNFQVGLLKRINRPYLWANVLYLMAICVVPFSASLVAAFPNHPASIRFFAINLLCTMAGQLLVFQCAHVFKLNRDGYSPAIRRAVIKRILLAPIFYISAIFIAQWDTQLAFLILIAPILIYLFPGEVDRYDEG